MCKGDLDYNDGSLLASRIRGKDYDTPLGTVIMGSDGIRDRDLDIKFFDAREGAFKVVLKRGPGKTKCTHHAIRSCR